MPIKLICLDADDTLWHNMRHFNATEEALYSLIAPFADRHVTREVLDACEARNLKLYGYGAKGFTLSMIETAVELVGDPLPQGVIAGILEAGRQLLAHPVELFDGIAETLEVLSTRGRLLLVTKGDLLHQEAKLAASGLGDMFSGIEIVSDKTAGLFADLFRREGVLPHEAVMAGDSLRSDIHPALEAGAWAAYVPQPGAWSHEVAAVPEQHPRFTQLVRLGDLPNWLDGLD
ncbi:HAD family hydrolase [Novosphingobium taihuense]|uniref:Putative hydrolase of the HAD superfamily n=1 Tax=Novosphingobium taihuense TaxID=260085 RepID=A0A7W7AA23_9SPHN|nr:HAD family hydrolase [Novosphingobium taihuense]MBB4612554.1 putative hydrolase of the HAD superfamily [Novosphingobium taihuense]TWH88094.1 putative hydrolase of the HAD superfamily [Novosphingobium taihuense]